jgi:DNA-binding transcriptional MerR regulator
MTEPAPLLYKMKDLCRLTGLPRQAIHFYIQKGLVPEGKKTGRNMAWYGQQHLERIRLIRQLQDERFLPLKAIKAVLDQNDEPFTPAQRRLLGEIKQRLAPSLNLGTDAPRETVDVLPLGEKYGLDTRDLDDAVEAGLLAVSHAVPGKALIARDDVWMVELLAGVRAAGFTRELGFGVELLTAFEESITQLFYRETDLLTKRLSHLPGEQVAAMVEAALPLVHTFLVRYHETKVRNFFTNL